MCEIANFLKIQIKATYSTKQLTWSPREYRDNLSLLLPKNNFNVNILPIAYFGNIQDMFINLQLSTRNLSQPIPQPLVFS